MNIFGVPLSTSPVNIYIRNKSVLRLNITTNFYTMSLMKIETHNPFIYIVFHIISMHSMKITEVHIFPTGNISFWIYNRSGFPW